MPRGVSIGKVAVAFDGSAGSRRAAALALEIAERFRAEVSFVVVVRAEAGETETVLAGLVPVSEDGRGLTALLEETVAHAKSKGIPAANVVFRRGDAADEMLAFLRERPQDLLFVGSRGLSRSRRLLLGSVSTRIVEAAPCPVVVVRPSAGRRGGGRGAPDAPPTP